jgi:hypothetical protein
MASTITAPPSKKKINKSGKLWAKFLTRAREDRDSAFKEFSLDDLVVADDIIEWWRGEHARPLANVNANLRYYLNKLDGGGSVTQRLKRRGTIIDKLCREPTMALTTMEDIGGCRAVVKTQTEAYQLWRRLRKNWIVHRERDYVAHPKPSGYRALHLIVLRKSRLIEVQIRTPLQDFWANQVEADSRRLRVDFKSGKGEDLVHAYYAAVSDFIALQERGESPDRELLDRLAATYEAAGPYLGEGRLDPPAAPPRRKEN